MAKLCLKASPGTPAWEFSGDLTLFRKRSVSIDAAEDGKLATKADAQTALPISLATLIFTASFGNIVVQSLGFPRMTQPH